MSQSKRDVQTGETGQQRVARCRNPKKSPIYPERYLPDDHPVQAQAYQYLVDGPPPGGRNV
jgi:hypothetical protein